MKKLFAIAAILAAAQIGGAWRWNPAARVKAEAASRGSLPAGSVDNAALASGIDAAKITTGNLPAAQVTNLVGVTVQGYDADLDDLADGSLTASKVASGYDAAGLVGDAPIAVLTNLYGGTPSSAILSNLVWDSGATTGNLEYTNGAITAP